MLLRFAMVPALCWTGSGLRAALPAEYEVCRAFLASPGAEQPADLLYDKLGIFFIYNAPYEDPERLGAFLRQRAGLELDPGLLRSFVAANRRPSPVDRKQFPAGLRFSPQFIRQGVYSLSRVGFNARGDQALLYASFSSLQEDGHGGFAYLEKRNGTWTVVRSAAVWMYGASVHPFNP
jgi:hypothetical protein